VKAGDIVEVEWMDHAFHTGEYDGQGLSSQRSIGYFVSEDDDVIRIAQSLTTDDRVLVAKPNETLVVDKRMLKKMRRIR